MDVIKLLPDSVANQIAAGEVIQRPASVVKELVENAVDAGATEINIIIKDAGRTLIQVVDNGSGMSPTDARLAFERHSTSKIRKADDLFSLHTMGFRGEALASICAVAQVDLRTMRQGDTCGTRIIINGSKLESQTPEACIPGSNMMVKNLFFNIPARRKFLKKDSVEMSNILREFERLALVNPTIELTIIHNDLTLHHLPSANLRSRIVDLFGKSLNAQLVPVQTNTDLVTINGFLSRPEYSRKRNPLQYLFVNGRNMRHPYFHRAIMQCYETLIPADEQPNYFINFQVDPNTIDVNIHPTKNEIKFEQEQTIRQILFAAVRETIGRYNGASEIDFSPSLEASSTPIPAPDFSAFPDSPQATTPASAASPYNPFHHHSSSAANWEELYKSFTSQAPSSPLDTTSLDLDTPSSNPDTDTTSLTGNIIPIGNRYVATRDAAGLRIIDLRRAHQAVLFHQFSSHQASHTSQQLLFPETISLSPDQIPLLQEIEPQLQSLGFNFTFDGINITILATPALPSNSINPGELLLLTLQNAANDSSTPSPSARAAAAMAIAASFRADRPLSDSELQHLLASLFSLPLPGFSPSGKLVFTIISPTDIARLL